MMQIELHLANLSIFLTVTLKFQFVDAPSGDIANFMLYSMCVFVLFIKLGNWIFR